MARFGLDWIGLGWNGSGTEWARTGLETRLETALDGLDWVALDWSGLVGVGTTTTTTTTTLDWIGLGCIGLEWIGWSWNGFGFDWAHIGLETRLKIGLDLDLGWTRE